jgi:fumarate hydratase, class II
MATSQGPSVLVIGGVGRNTGLNSCLGYERAAELAKEAFATGKTVRGLCIEKKILPEKQLNEVLDPRRMTRPRP